MGMLPVERSVGGDLVAAGGATILRGLPPCVTAAASDDGCACILGVRAAAGPASLFDTSLGQLACTRFLALGRTSIWWSTPAFGGCQASEVPPETQFLLLELAPDGPFALLLPLIDSDRFRGTLRPPRDGSERLCLRMESGDPAALTQQCSSALLVVAGTDPFELIQRGVALAARLSGTAKPRSAKQVPPSADVFGWCTWDAFYSRVSAAGINEGLESLVKGGAPPGFVIIDDGWQQTDVDPQYRTTATQSSSPGSQGVGEHLEAAKSEDEPLLPSSDSDDEAGEHSKQEWGWPWPTTASGTLPLVLQARSSISSLFSVIRAWLANAVDALRGCAARLESALLLRCRRTLEELPATSWRMGLFAALAAGPFRSTIVRYYATASDHTRRLCSVRANSKFFSPSAGPDHAFNSTEEDLCCVVAAMKERYGVRYVFAWHAMGGYWGGLSAGEREMQKYHARNLLPSPSPSLLEIDPAIAWQQPVLAGVTLPTDPTQLHGDMHSYLAGCGVDGVKVDVQSTIGLLGGPGLSAAYHASLEDSIRRHFPGNLLLNCMCHSSEDLYRMEDSNLARVSDDFYPSLPPSHTAHIANCAYNSLWMGEIVIPDWDMWHSRHDKALLHATARAVSGGPVYVSDKPGCHDFALLRRMVLPDGSVLRCELPGRPTADCLFADASRDGKTALKVWNSNPVTGVVAVFNVQGAAFSRSVRRFVTHDTSPPALAAAVSPADVPTLRGAAQRFAAYVDSTKELALLPLEGSLTVRAEGGGGSDLVTLSPLLAAGGVSVAPIGLVSMLNAGGAVLSCTLSGGAAPAAAAGEGEEAAEEVGGFQVVPPPLPPVCRLQLRGCGAFLCYASQHPAAVEVDGDAVAFEFDAAKGALSFELPVGVSMLKDCEIRF